jgi:hypothetical protein
MKIFARLVVLIAIARMAGCQSPVYDADVQFVERLVVKGVLTPGKTVSGISIGRTLPVTTIPHPEDFEVHDATATIVVDGIRYSLRHVGNGLYENGTLVAFSGKSYDLSVEWNGHKAVAHTLVPFLPDTTALVLSRPYVPYYSNMYRYILDAALAPHAGETYGGGWSHTIVRANYPNDSLIYDPIPETFTNSVLIRSREIQSDGKAHLAIEGYLSPSTSPLIIDTLWVTISSFDEQFYDYYYSSGSPTSFEELVLGIVPGAITWNVSGDGIGMFIGKASITKALLLTQAILGTNPKRRTQEQRQ